jgi:RNA-directed DNA polymerase
VVRQLRAALHNREQGKPGREGETLEQLKGLAAFIHMTDPEKGRAFLARIEALEGRTPSSPSKRDPDAQTPD